MIQYHKVQRKDDVMPTQIKISKEMILDAAFDIVRNQVMEKLSNRELANKLKCSIRPIFVLRVVYKPFFEYSLSLLL